jgi:NAD(P)-dependent dehydrogenase (short-subunit alcohol dehydrogenase family)
MVLDKFRIDRKTALITGSCRGLGAAIALALAGAGANVVCHGRTADGENVAEKIRQLGRKSVYIAGDIADSGFQAKLVSATIEQFGSIDILVNNAAGKDARLQPNIPRNFGMKLSPPICLLYSAFPSSPVRTC